MRFLTAGLLSLFAFAVAPFSTFSQETPTLDFFHGRECPHCQNQKKWLPKLQQAYPDLVVNEYEVWHDTENQVLWTQRLSEIGEAASGVPSSIIGDTHIVGFSPDRILAVLEEKYGPPAVDISTVEVTPEEESNQDLALIVSLVVAIGLGIGIAFLGKKS